jgi:hypothetical protein
VVFREGHRDYDPESPRVVTGDYFSLYCDKIFVNLS